MQAESVALLIPVVSVIAVFTFIAVAAWSDNRRRERESFYRHETYRKIMDSPGDSSDAVLRLMREREMQERRKKVEGLKLGGMITFVAGIGVMIFLFALIDEAKVYLAGLIPALIGLALMFYGFVLAGGRKDDQDGSRS